MSTQTGHIFEMHNAFHLRYYIHSNGGKRKQKSHKLCPKNTEYPSKDARSVLTLAENFILKINAENEANTIADHLTVKAHRCPVCNSKCPRTIQGKFVSQ